MNIEIKINYHIIYLPPDNYEYGNKYMTDLILKLAHGNLTVNEYNEQTGKTRLVILTPNNKEHNEMEFTIDGEVRNVDVGKKVSFLYNTTNQEFKAFVFSKEEFENRFSNKNDTIQKNPSHTEDLSISKIANEWKQNIPFLNEKRWFDVRFTSHICSDEQLSQVFKAINASSISSTLKIGFQDYLSKLKNVRYKNIMNIEEEYKTFIKNKAEKAMGKK